MERAAREVGDVGRLARGGAANALAAAVATVAGLLIIVLAGRSMSPAEYATFAAVWGLVFGTAAVVAALEPEVARQHSIAPGPIDRTQNLTMIVVALGAALGVGALLVLFADELHVQLLFIALCAVASSALFTSMFVARGYLAGTLRLVPLAWLTVSEAGVRLGVVVAGLLLSRDPVPTFALAALVSSWVGLPILASRSSWTRGIVTPAASLRRTSLLMGGNAMAALLITGAPVLVSLAMAEAPAADVGQMQSAVVVSRFPLMALLLLQSLLVPVFTRRRSLETRQDFRAVVTALVLALPLMTAVAYFLGPWALSVLYGEEYAVDAQAIALLTLGATALGGIQVLVALAVAADHHRLAMMSLLPALVVTVVIAFLGGLPGELRIPNALALGPLVGFFVAVTVTYSWRKQSRSGHPSGFEALGGVAHGD